MSEAFVESHAAAQLLILRIVPMPTSKLGPPQPMAMPEVMMMPHVILRHPPDRQNPHLLSYRERADVVRALQQRGEEWTKLAGPGAMGWAFSTLVPMRDRPPPMPPGPDGLLRPYPTVTVTLGADGN